MLKPTGLGVLAGVLFMGVEGLGSLYLIRSLLPLTEGSQASHFAMVTYVWLAFNVLGTALGFVTARAAARLNHRGDLQALARNARLVGLIMLVPVATLAGLVLLCLYGLGRTSPMMVLTWSGFVGGHLVRLLGLIRVFVQVGDGRLGADKWYQLTCVSLFYGTAIPAVHAGASIGCVALLYVMATAFAATGARVWNGRIKTEGDDSPASLGVDAPRSLARQSAHMIAFTAAGFVAGNADAFVARWLLADHGFVQYALSAKVGQVIALVAALVPSVLGPRITRLHRSGDRALSATTRRFALIATISIAAVGAAMVVLARGPIAQWLSPARYDIVQATLWIVALSAVLQAWSLGLTNAINSVGGSGLIAVTLTSACVTVSVAYVAGRAFGAPGIAAGMVAGSVIMMLGALTITHKTFAPAYERPITPPSDR